MYGLDGIESCMVMRYEVMYGTDGTRFCMEQMNEKDCPGVV